MAKIHQKTIVRSDKEVLHLAHGLGDGAGALHRDLRQRLAEDGWDVPEECLDQLIRSLVSVLLAQHHRLSEAVCDRQEAVDYGREVRLRRDEASRQVYDLLVSLRRILHGTVGRKGVRANFGRGKTPRQPREVFALARTLRRRLQDADTRRELCGTIGSEETLLHWLRQLDDPYERLRFYLRQVGTTEVAERRTVPGVETSKAEMRRRQRFVHQLLEGLYGLAGAEEVFRALRHEAPQRTEAADPGPARPADETTAAEPLGSRTTASVAASAAVEADREAQRRAPSSPDAADKPLDPVDLHGSERPAARPGVDPVKPARSAATTAPEAVPGSEESPAGADPELHRDTGPPEEVRPRVWNVFQRIKTLPHRMRNPGKPAEITASEEKAA